MIAYFLLDYLFLNVGTYDIAIRKCEEGPYSGDSPFNKESRLVALFK